MDLQFIFEQCLCSLFGKTNNLSIDEIKKPSSFEAHLHKSTNEIKRNICNIRKVHSSHYSSAKKKQKLQIAFTLSFFRAVPFCVISMDIFKWIFKAGYEVFYSQLRPCEIKILLWQINISRIFDDT